MREEFEKAQKSSPLAGIASGGVSGGGFDVAGFLAGSKSGGENDREPEPETGKGKGGRRRG